MSALGSGPRTCNEPSLLSVLPQGLGGKEWGRWIHKNAHQILPSSKIVFQASLGPCDWLCEIVQVWKMSMVLLALLFSLLVLSFGVLPAHESELRCHKLGWGVGGGGSGGVSARQ